MTAQTITHQDPRRFQSTCPAWGMITGSRLRTKVDQFQSTHPHKSVISNLPRRLSKQMFQSTHPHGVRSNRLMKSMVYCCFNPHTCVIARPRLLIRSSWFPSFNPHASMVRDTILGFHFIPNDVSIHTPMWGYDKFNPDAKCPLWEFQSTHPCDICRKLRFTSECSFNPRTHAQAR